MKRLFTLLMALLLTWIGASAQVDYSYLINTGTWSSTGTYNHYVAHELFQETAYTSGRVLYQTINGLPAGTYEVTFYAAANSTGNRDTITDDAYGDNIAQAFANDAYEAVTVIQQTACTPSDYEYTLTCTVDESGELVYGLQNVATGGNWYVCQGVSLYSTSETPTQLSLNEGDVVESEGDPSTEDFHHWIISGPSSGEFALNTWSTEGEASGMVTPFIQYWIGSGSVLGAATLRHYQLGGLPAGLYTVTLDARAFDENSTTEITEGTILIHANDASVDLTTGTHNTFNGVSAEVYGTYNLVAEVGEAGTLDINITVAVESACDWVSWKNLKVVYDGESLPDLDYVEGDMNAEVEQAMKDAVDAYNASKSTADYTAALAAIAAAEESVAYYAEIAELAANLDAAGQAVWETTDTYEKYTAKTLETTDDFGEDMAAAQMAQTTEGTDWSCVMRYLGTWTGSTTELTVDGSKVEEDYQTTQYSGTAASPTKILYKTIEGIPAGTYSVSFYAEANATQGRGFTTTAGENIAQVFANDAVEDITVNTYTVIGGGDQHSWLDTDLYTFTSCTVDLNGKIEFGIQNVGEGGNWYTAMASNLTLVALSTEVPEDTKSDYENGDVATIYGHSYNVKSDNLVENHSFELGFDGWTDATDNHNTLSSSYFELRSDNAQDGEVYLVGTTNAGSTAAGSICTGWAIEAGKTYYFSYYVKGLTSNTDGGYLRTDIVNELSDEDSGVIFATPTVTTEWQKIEYLFTNTDYSLLQVEFRWLNNQWGFDNFQLYVVEPAEDVLDDSEYKTDDEVTVDGKTYTVVGDNMFVNGGFNADMYGWTAAGYYVAADPDNFDVEEEGGFNEGAYLVASSAGTSDVKTPSQAIAVEEGKTYLFIGYTSGKTPTSSNVQYNALFKMEDAVTEASSDKIIVQLEWGADYEQTASDWTKTIGVFEATTEYVGMRMGWSGGSYDGFQLYEVEAVPVTIEWEMTSAEWGTIILPFEADVPDGLTAYSCDEVSGDELVLTEATPLEANTPYIMAGAAATYEFKGVAVDAENGLTAGLLTGTYETMDCDALLEAAGTGTVYLLQNQTDVDGVAFYPVIEDESAEATLTANHCYLLVPSSVSPTALRLPGMATAIEAVESDVIANDAIYDLSDRRVSKAVKGVYIQNGKKVLVK